jgi:AcrR family transcriptional regulator
LITEQKILSTALDMLRRDGVEGLSQRRLAAELGVTPMTLYRYFPSKDAILDAIGDQAIAITDRPDPTAPWHAQLRDLLIAIHDGLQRSPGVAELMATRSMNGSGIDDVRERILALLVGGGVSEDEALVVLGVINRFLLGCALVEGRTRDRQNGRRLSALDSDRYPMLTTLADRYHDHDAAQAGLAGIDVIIADSRQRARQQ